MLKNLSLHNFKCLQNCSLNFKPLSILVGGNGVGKSSIIQSLLITKEVLNNIKLDGYEQEVVEVRINGPYLLNLGLAKNVLSTNADSTSMDFKLIQQDNENAISFSLSFDETFGEHILKAETVTFDNINNVPLNSNFSYLNAERVGPRQALNMGPTSEWDVGFRGEYTSHVIFRADRANKVVHELLKLVDTTRFSRQVEAWLSQVVPNTQLDYKVLEEVNMVSLKYKNASIDTDFFPPPNTGFGISYSLPIFVAGLLLSSEGAGGTLIVENPEAHLHPLGQSRMGRFLALLSLTGVQVIVETHSEHIVNGVRLELAREGRTENMIINYLEHEDTGINITEIGVSETGDLSEWPSGFFDQEEKDLKELFLLRRQKR